MGSPTKKTKAKAKPKSPYPMIVYASVKFEGKTDLEKVFGPSPTVVAKHGKAVLSDNRSKLRARLDQDSEYVKKYLAYEAFYEFAGGVFGYLTKEHGRLWHLSIVMSDYGQYPDPRQKEFDTWQEAWSYVTDRLPES